MLHAIRFFEVDELDQDFSQGGLTGLHARFADLLSSFRLKKGFICAITVSSLFFAAIQNEVLNKCVEASEVSVFGRASSYEAGKDLFWRPLMLEGRWKRRYLLFLVFVSFSTLCLIAMITFFSSHLSDGFAWRRQLTGFLFSALCILGTFAVFFPRHCARSPRKERLINEGSDSSLEREQDLQKSSSIGGVTILHGHHPPCPPYRQHELVLGKKTLCSACMGLFCGALISVAGASYVFLQQVPYSLPYGIIFTLGSILIVVGLGLYVLALPLGPVWRFSFNALMIVGMLLALVGVDGKAHSLALNAFLIGFFIFVLFTRISLSQDTNEQICATCGQTCVI